MIFASGYQLHVYSLLIMFRHLFSIVSEMSAFNKGFIVESLFTALVARPRQGRVLLIGVSGWDNPALTPRWNQSIRTIPGPRLR